MNVVYSFKFFIVDGSKVTSTFYSYLFIVNDNICSVKYLIVTIHIQSVILYMSSVIV